LGCLASAKVVADFMYIFCVYTYRGHHQKKREGTRAVHEAPQKGTAQHLIAAAHSDARCTQSIPKCWI